MESGNQSSKPQIMAHFSNRDGVITCGRGGKKKWYQDYQLQKHDYISKLSTQKTIVYSDLLSHKGYYTFKMLLFYTMLQPQFLPPTRWELVKPVITSSKPGLPIPHHWAVKTTPQPLQSSRSESLASYKDNLWNRLHEEKKCMRNPHHLNMKNIKYHGKLLEHL